MQKRIVASVCFVVTMIYAGAVAAEYRNYVHSGCTKDGVKITQEILWNCEGKCKTTPLKPAIMREAKDSRNVFPKAVSGYTKAQVAKNQHFPALRQLARIKRPLHFNQPKFGGGC